MRSPMDSSVVVVAVCTETLVVAPLCSVWWVLFTIVNVLVMLVYNSVVVVGDALQ